MISFQNQLRGAALVVAVLAGASYVLLRLVYVQFYGAFNLRPEDVGLGQSQFFSQALAGPVLVVAFAALIILLLVVVAVVYSAIREGVVRNCSRLIDAARAHDDHHELAREVRRRRRAVIDATRQRLQRHWQVMGATALALAALVVVAALLVSARQAAAQVRLEGRAVANVSVDYGGVSVPLLVFQALPVQLYQGSDGRPADLPGAGECALLLGTSDDQLVLYNVREGRTYLVPSSGLLVELEATDLPSACLPADVTSLSTRGMR